MTIYVLRRSSAWISILSILFVSCAPGALKGSGRKSNEASQIEKPYVVMISIDGYRYDYTDLYSPPTLKEFRSQGAAAQGLIPVYPSITFTNHYSIVTGLYAENHGLVANLFYDPILKQEYKRSNKSVVQDGRWYQGEPLWVAAEKQGMLSASYYWPGSEAPIQGERPTYYYEYNKKTELMDRVGQVKQWLELPAEERPHLVLFYISDVDTAGHQFGPDSPQVRQAISKADEAVAKILSDLKSLSLPINVIILSDHGMQALRPEQVEFLDDYVDLTGVRVLGDGPQVLLYSEDSQKLEMIYQGLSKKGKHFKVFKRTQLPEKYHYSKNPRAGDLVVIADSPYSIGLRQHHSPMVAGNHGYDPDVTPSMKGIFYARGPQVKSHVEIEPFRNIHVYPFVLDLLGLKVLSPIDGKAAVLKSIEVGE